MIRTAHASILLTATLGFSALGCEPAESPESPETDVEAVAAPASDSALSVTIEEALRKLDLGEDVATAKATLREVADDRAATGEERAHALLGLSRALELEGDLDGAVALVEQVLAEQGDKHSSELRDATKKRLRRLLTGQDLEPESPRRDEPVPPVARALAGVFPLDEKDTALVRVVTFGQTGTSDRLGIYNVGSAHRDIKQEKCPLCEGGVSVHMSKSSYGSWTSIPAAKADTTDDMPDLQHSLVVMYYDLDRNRVPSRYDEYLALPSDEIAARLATGDGVVAVRTRDGAPPLVVVAAPRAGQLPVVEEALAQMSTLPTEPVTVPLARKLLPEEIRGVIFTARGRYRACYEELLARQPAAEGRIAASFEIQGDGTVRDARVDESDTTFDDDALRRCVVGTFEALTFPATGEVTTVTYPFLMTPGDEP